MDGYFQHEILLESPREPDEEPTKMGFFAIVEQLHSSEHAPFKRHRAFFSWRRWKRCSICRPAVAISSGIVATLIGIVYFMFFSTVHNPVHSSQCATIYFTATACAIGGQELSFADGNSTTALTELFTLLSPGNAVRAELVTLLDSRHFLEAARCPTWAEWSSENNSCKVKDAKGCLVGEPSEEKFHFWQDPASDKRQCSVNHYSTPQGDGKKWAAVIPCNETDQSQRGWRFIDGAITYRRQLCLTASQHAPIMRLIECDGSSEQNWTHYMGTFVHSSKSCLNAWRGYGPTAGLYDCPGQFEGDINEVWHMNGDMISDKAGDCLTLVDKNPEVASLWGGSCTCPDGSVYRVADHTDMCSSVKCFGGIPGTCTKTGLSIGESGAEVSCKPDFLSTARIREANPHRDHACWEPDGMPRFIAHSFVSNWSVSHHSSWSSTHWMSLLGWNPKDKTPDTRKFKDFWTFYKMFNSTLAGQTCRSRFGHGRKGGPVLSV